MNALSRPLRRSFHPLATLTVATVALTVMGLAWTLSAHAGPAPTPAPSDRDEYFKGRIVAIERTDVQEFAGNEHLMQVLRVRIQDRAGQERDVRAEHSVPLTLARDQALRPGEAVTVARARGPSGPTYYITDRYRLSSLAVVLGLFVLAVVWFSRTRGLTSVIGLGVSILVLARYVVPRILAGQSPLAVSLLGALAIAATSIYLAHGFSRRTSVALVGTLITLGIAATLAIAFVRATGLTGLGSEEALTLQVGSLESLNLRGLLLGGIILGALGVLEDITTAQAAAVEEISRANPRLAAQDLYRRGLSVGQEHITALVNTLVLAYAGASLPLFLLFAIQMDQPLWVTLNTEFVAQEIVRSLVGSLALVLAVPITTWLAAQLLRVQEEEVSPFEQGQYSHLHR